MYIVGVYSLLNLFYVFHLNSLFTAVPLQPPKGALRILTSLWLLLSFILCTVYRSNLKAMLILPNIQLPFDNIDELSYSNLPVWLSLNSILHENAMVMLSTWRQADTDIYKDRENRALVHTQKKKKKKTSVGSTPPCSPHVVMPLLVIASLVILG